MNNRRKNIFLYVFITLCLIGAGLMFYFSLNPKIEKGGYNKTPSKKVTSHKVKVSESIENIYDATVMIKVYKNGNITSTGSGFIYRKAGNYAYLLTNQHVVGNYKKVGVYLSSGEEVDGDVLGSDEYMDIAVVRIDAKYAKEVARINAKDSFKIGDPIYTIGTPVSEVHFNTVTSGIISGIDRKITVSVKSPHDWIQKTIQVDAAINPGNSGGPLVNEAGEVIGINSIKLVDSKIEGMAFSIKISDVMKHIDNLESGKGITRPTLGIRFIDVNDALAIRPEGIDIPKGVNYGAIVHETIPGSAAYNKLKKGDIILRINKEEVSNQAYLKYLLYQYHPGDVINIEFLRNGKPYNVDVKLQS